VIDGRVSEEDTTQFVIDMIEEAVPKCVAALHFFGDKLGAAPEGGTRPIVKLQFEEILKVKPKLLIGWSEPKFLAPSSSEVHEFLAAAREVLGTDYWQMDSQKCAVEFVKRLKELLKPRRTPRSPRTVYVMYDSSDSNEGVAIEQYLAGLSYAPLSLPKEGWDDGKEYREAHKQLLQDSPYFYIYHGKVRAPWSHLKRNETLQAKQEENSRALLGGVV
jgi:hypothetical protein